jgi:hypothetical protein
MVVRRIIAVAAILCTAIIAGGCADSGNFAVSGKVGTLGLGGDVAAKLTDNVDARVGYSGLDVDIDGKEIDDIDYDFNIGLSSFEALADWYVFDGSFRLTGGAVYMDNSVDMKAVPTGPKEIGDNTYYPSDIGTLTGAVDIDGLSPYVGIGWGNPFKSDSRLGFTCDIGVAFISSPDVSLRANGPIASDPTFRADLEKERKDIEDDMGVVRIYPVISLGLYFRF